MALALVGPCMLAAPLVAVAFILAIPLWPVAVVTTFGCWALSAVLERLFLLLGFDALEGWSASMWRLFLTVLTPWNYFDPPKKE